ncbi:MAG: hypothetical protein GF347_02520 [Candidatus Moranbacteria bacterium]|nr:hypothetical protein [Candidatus Moranbacteria bacterium]
MSREGEKAESTCPKCGKKCNQYSMIHYEDSLLCASCTKESQENAKKEYCKKCNKFSKKVSMVIKDESLYCPGCYKEEKEEEKKKESKNRPNLT